MKMIKYLEIRSINTQKVLFICLTLIILLTNGYAEASNTLRVSADGRFILKPDGSPFTWIGDTGWGLFCESRSDVDYYLNDRKNKGFTVIQAVALWISGNDYKMRANTYGDYPVHNNNPALPNDSYFAHVDYCINKAESMGLYTAMLPTWGSWVNPEWSGTKIFNVSNARAYGEYLGNRYKNNKIIWVLGGDRNPGDINIWRAMAKGIAIGAIGVEDYSQVLITYHPRGGQGYPKSSSSYHVHNETWLDFNMIQSGHSRNTTNYDWIIQDYGKSPVKPVLDGEPRYEGIGVSLEIDDYDVRKSAYWSIFAGAAGHTYGGHEVWFFWNPGDHPSSTSHWNFDTPWKTALNFTGAHDMKHLKTLIESRPMLKRIPDQSIVTSGTNSGDNRVQAARASDGSYAFVYISSGDPVTVDLGKINSGDVEAQWYDPRNGNYSAIGIYKANGTRQFSPPSYGYGNDWILVLDAYELTDTTPPAVPNNLRTR
jgi:hypothetical protein